MGTTAYMECALTCQLLRINSIPYGHYCLYGMCSYMSTLKDKQHLLRNQEQKASTSKYVNQNSSTKISIERVLNIISLHLKKALSFI